MAKRFRTYLVQVEIPKHLRAAAGRLRFKRSLGTDSLTEANRLKHRHVAEFKRRISRLEAAHGVSDAVAKLMADAIDVQERAERLRGVTVIHPGTGEELALDDIELSEAADRAKEIAEEHGGAVGERYHRVAKGEAFVRDLAEQWLSESEGQVRDSVRGQNRAACERFLEWSGQHITVAEVDRRKAGDYVAFLISTASGLKRSTAKRHVRTLHRLWRWVESRRPEVMNPWGRHEFGRADARTRKSLSEESLSKLLRGSADPRSRYGRTLHDLLRLALVTGARIEELCGLRPVDIEKRKDGYWLTFPYSREGEPQNWKGKSSSAGRTVPLHHAASHVLVHRLKKHRGADYIFPDLTPGGADKRRSWNVTRAFAAFRKRVGVTQPGEVFHSTRNTFITHMEGAGVPLPTIQLIVGQQRSTSIGVTAVYTTGAKLDLRREVEKLNYGREIMRLIASPFRP